MMNLSKRSTFTGLAFAFLLPAHATMASVMFHDMGASSSGEASTGNITTHQIGSSSAETLDTATKNLIDFATGSATGVTFAVSGAGAMDGRNGGETAPPASGTDAAAFFDVAGLNLSNGQIYTTSSFTFTLGGLDQNKLYDLAFWGNRVANGSGLERFTLSGLDNTPTNLSTERDGLSIRVTDFTTDIHTGYSTSTTDGNIIRWNNIASGVDGIITLTVDADRENPDTNTAFVSAMRLEATPIPEPAAATALLGLCSLGLVLTRRRR